MSEETPPVRSEVADGVMTLTLCDLENKNALGAALVGGLADAIAAGDRDDLVRVIVVTNEGSVFCAGANLKEQSTATSASSARLTRLDELFTLIRSTSTPVVGRIAGHAVGGGVGLAAAFDISVADEDATFGFTEVRLGVTPAIISVVCLPKMRAGEAKEAFLRGNRFSGRRAAELGLVNHAVPAGELDATVRAIVDDLVLGGPVALGVAKQLLREVPAMTSDDAYAWTSRLSAELFASDEAKAGMAAFLDRQPPPWAP